MKKIFRGTEMTPIELYTIQYNIIQKSLKSIQGQKQYTLSNVTY